MIYRTFAILYFDAVIDGHSLATLGIAKSFALVVEVIWSINRIVSNKDQSQSRNRSLRRISVLESDASTSIGNNTLSASSWC